MNGLLRSGGIALILVVLVFAGRSWSEPKKPPLPRTRVALINLSYVIKNYQKYLNFQAEIKTEVDRYQKIDKDLRKQIDRLTKQADDKDLDAEKKAELEKKLKQLKRDLEDNAAETKKVLGKKSDDMMVLLYKEVQSAAQRYAKAHDLELVLHYNDADDKTEPASFWSSANVARKMQAGACVPLYIAPGMDISLEIVAAMNDGLRTD